MQFSFSDATGGLNLVASDRAVKTNEARDTYNCDNYSDGSILKSNGYTTVSDAATQPDEIVGMHEYIQDDGTVYYMVASADELFTMDTGTGVFTSQQTGLDNQVARFANFNNFAILVNGVDIPQVFDGATVTTLSGFPGDLTTSGYPSLITVHKNRLFLSGDPTKPYRVYVSAAGDHNDFTTANGAFSFDVNIADGQPITAMASFFDSLNIFKTRSVHNLTGSTTPGATAVDPFKVRPLVNGLGCEAPGSVITIGNDQFYMGSDHISTIKTTAAYGDVLTVSLAAKIVPAILEINREAIQGAFAVHHRAKEQVWFFFPTSSNTENNAVYIYNYRLKSWTRRSGFTGSCGIYFENKPWIGDYDGTVNKHDFGGTYDGGAFTGYWTTGNSPYGNYLATKRIRNIDVTAKRYGDWLIRVDSAWDYRGFTTRFDVDTSTAGSNALWGTAIWGMDSWSTETSIQNRRLSGIGRGKVHQLKFSNNGADEPFQVFGWDVDAQMCGSRPVAKG